MVESVPPTFPPIGGRESRQRWVRILIEHNGGTSVTVPLAEEAKKIKKVLLKARTVIYGGKRPFAHTAHSISKAI